MPQLETSHIFLDILILISTVGIGVWVTCYSTCLVSNMYYDTICKYIINIHCSLTYFMKY